MSGLLIDGKSYPVEGATVITSTENPSVRLSIGDCRPRTTRWIRQLTVHSTQGKDPQRITDDVPNGLHTIDVAKYWAGDPHHGGAHIVVEGNTIACLADLMLVEAYHATTVNPHSVGIEMVQKPNGDIAASTIDTTIRMLAVMSDVMGVPRQTTSRAYRDNTIIERLRRGGADVVGTFGHRDNAWQFPEWLTADMRARYPNGYASRGRGDPGDEFYRRLIVAGWRAFNIDAREEIAYWKRRQQSLNDENGAKLVIDGVCGPSTVRTLRERGLWNGGLLPSLT